jgi:hypothetical protein
MEKEGHMVGQLLSAQCSSGVVNKPRTVMLGIAGARGVAVTWHSWHAGNPTTVAPDSSGSATLGSGGVDGQ